MLIEDLLYWKLNRKKKNLPIVLQSRKTEKMNNFILTSFSLKTKVRVSSCVNHFELTNPKTVHAHVFCFSIQSVLFSQEKKGDDLAYITGNSRKVILPRERV